MLPRQFREITEKGKGDLIVLFCNVGILIGSEKGVSHTTIGGHSSQSTNHKVIEKKDACNEW